MGKEGGQPCYLKSATSLTFKLRETDLKRSGNTRLKGGYLISKGSAVIIHELTDWGGPVGWGLGAAVSGSLTWHRQYSVGIGLRRMMASPCCEKTAIRPYVVNYCSSKNSVEVLK